jgi:hypothetical protein
MRGSVDASSTTTGAAAAADVAFMGIADLFSRREQFKPAPSFRTTLKTGCTQNKSQHLSTQCYKVVNIGAFHTGSKPSRNQKDGSRLNEIHPCKNGQKRGLSSRLFTREHHLPARP